MSLYLPPGVTRRMLAERERQVAEMQRQMLVLPELREWNRKLKQIDERLQLVFCPENTHAPGLKSNRYHIIRQIPGAPPGIVVHEDPETGKFMEPNSYLLKRLEESDLWDDRVQGDREKRRKALRRAAEREREQERQERVEEMRDRVKARFATSIRVPREV